MKKILISILSATILFLVSCKEDGLPSNAVISFPITELVITIHDLDYRAVPKMSEELSVTDSMTLTVRRPSETGLIKQLYLAPGFTTDLSTGNEVGFDGDGELDIVVTHKGQQKSYCVKMNHQGPPLLYLTHAGVKDGEGNGNYVDTETAMKMASAKYDDDYEGYIDLSNAVWHSPVIVTADLKQYTDCSGGGSEVIQSFTLEMKDQPEANGDHFYNGGPWGNWTSDHGNGAIANPYGVWKLNFNTTSLELTMQHTLWAIEGTATGGQKTAMDFDSQTRLWKITTTLSEGTFKFSTIPFTGTDTAIVYGAASGNDLSIDGGFIDVAQPGSYTVGLDIFNPPYYTYSITKD